MGRSSLVRDWRSRSRGLRCGDECEVRDDRLCAADGDLLQPPMSKIRELTPSERRQAGCGCAILVIFFVIACVGSLGNAMCETTTYAQSNSPSGTTDARVQMTDCGAVSGFSRIVWVQPRWLPQSRALSCRAVAFNGQPAVKLGWTVDSLTITTNSPRESIIANANKCYGWSINVSHAH